MPPKKTTPGSVSESKKKPDPKPKKTTVSKSGLKNAGWLVIVESPSKCKKIEEYIGPEYRCISSKGHFREIGSLKQINTKTDFQCSYRIIESKADHVAWMRPIVADYVQNRILLASDDDREGEAIAWHLCDEFGLDPRLVPRVVFHEITKPAILAAVLAPRRIDLSLVAAQQTRQVLDLIVGFRVSPMLWRTISNSKKNSLSAGRCQTPALRLVYEKEQEIRRTLQNVSIKYRVVAHFFDQMLPFVLQGPPIVSSQEMRDFIERSCGFDHQITVDTERPSTRSAPKPLTTSKLLQAASSQLSLSPKKTMDLAQILYQSGLITYMRTESTKYSPVFLNSAKEFIYRKYSVVAQSPEKWLADLSALENRESANPHEAIRPTNLDFMVFEHENAALVKLYQLIWRTTVESCFAEAKYTVADIHASCPPILSDTTKSKHQYTYVWEMPVFLGWKLVEQEIKSASKKYSETRDAALVPALFYFQSFAASGQPVQLRSIEASCVEKDAPPSHFTEASLVQKLEDLGIGRPSTFSSLVETIQDRGYVLRTDVPGREIECTEYVLRNGNNKNKNNECSIETIPLKKRFGEEKRKLVLQPIGEIVIDYLLRGFDSLFAYDYTGKMESALDVIASQPIHDQALTLSTNVCRQCYDEIGALLKTIQPNTNETPSSDEDQPDVLELDDTTSQLAGKITYPVKDEPNKRIVFHPYGVSIQIHSPNVETGEPATTYVNVRPDLVFDMEVAKRGEYTFSELVESGLGNYDGEPVQIKRGKYGEYIQWGKNTLSLKSGPSPPYTRSKIVEFIELKKGSIQTSLVEPKNKMILLEIDEHTSVRNGKYGPYIFHQPPNKKTPDFHSLKGFKGNVESKSDILKWIDSKIPTLCIRK
jgi:DNA topoisomerase-1